MTQDQDFGFTVTKVEKRIYDDTQGRYTGLVPTGDLMVSLPHQCDEWMVAEGSPDQVFWELEMFIKEAKQAQEKVSQYIRGETDL